MMFSEGEAQQLIEILTEKAGIVQDTWHTATQKGDPVAVLKRQLEEKEKQLTAEQEDVAAAKNKLRELSKELAAERAKAVAVEAKLKEQLLTREREITAVQARMQASYQDHVSETQQLQGKIRTLQEQLENGPNTQLARLQQENSILRDALNQATSQTESKQNAELAKLRQECNKLMKELSDKSEVLQQEEQQRKSWEIKAAASEKQIEQLQASQREVEVTLQKRLDEVSDELRKTQTSYKSLLADTEKTKGQQQSIAELQAKLLSSEAEVKSKLLELDNVKGKLQDAGSENTKLLERLKSIEALLEAGQMREAANEAEMKQLRGGFEILHSANKQLGGLWHDVWLIALCVRSRQDLREKNWKAMEALTTMEKACEEKLLAATKAKEELAQQLDALQTRTKQTLLSAFPGVTVSSQQVGMGFLRPLKWEPLAPPEAPNSVTRSLAQILREALAQLRLCQQEGMLRDLQKSVEEEEQVWKAKLTASEEELQKVRVWSTPGFIARGAGLTGAEGLLLKEYTSLLETQLENHLETASSERQNYTKEVEGLRQLLSESQEQLEAAKTETQKQSKELALVREDIWSCLGLVCKPSCGGGILPAGSGRGGRHSQQTHQGPGAVRVRMREVPLVCGLTEYVSPFQAQSSACSLQAELEKLRLAENAAASDTEDAQHLKERLEKEKKLTKDLGQAATKLQELLKVTQDQLAKERETVKKLKEQLQETGEEDSSKEGTSV
uniref:Ribosome binding protein 1 n=1 Tax=Strix occidentalis caurina TaxID=311401 RepID=A0A8D0KZC0_STROC